MNGFSFHTGPFRYCVLAYWFVLSSSLLPNCSAAQDDATSRKSAEPVMEACKATSLLQASSHRNTIVQNYTLMHGSLTRVVDKRNWGAPLVLIVTLAVILSLACMKMYSDYA